MKVLPLRDEVRAPKPEEPPPDVLAAMAYRDETQKLIAEWRPGRLSDETIEAEAVAYRASPVSGIVPFVCWMMIRKVEGL